MEQSDQRGENGQVQLKISNYLDYFIFLHDSEVSCNRMVHQFLAVCENIGCPVAMDKTEWALQAIIFLGILLNGKHCTLSIPEDKCRKAIALLNWAVQQRSITIKFFQRLTGILNFLGKAIIPGRTFTRLMYKKLKVTTDDGFKLKQYHHVNADKSFKKDCIVWREFLEQAGPSNLCRPFVDLDYKVHATTLNFYTDASLNENFRIGGVLGNRFFVGQWPIGFIRQENPSIEFAELLAQVAGILTWGGDPQLRNTRVIDFCDNTSVRSMVNNLTTGCIKCMKLIRLLVLDCLRSNRRVFVKYVKSKENHLADPLSRMDFDTFWNKALESMKPLPDMIDKAVWLVQNIWNDC